MNFYVASPWRSSQVAVTVMDILETLGHKITVDWTQHEEIHKPPTTLQDKDTLERYGQEDLLGVKSCDCYVGIFLSPESSTKGALVELGIALALNRQVFIIGAGISDCIFYYLPGIRRFDNIERFVEYIKRKLI